ncbi:MAG TPA: DUF6644 family protein [Vicinamibacteria bacterium]
MTLLPLFEWFEATELGQTIQSSLYLFPVIESVHLIAFAILGGTVLLVNLRLLGVAFRGEPVGRLAEAARPWRRGALFFAIATGSLLFVSEPIKLYYSDPFWVKMGCLALALGFDFALRRPIVRAGGDGFAAKLGGLVSLGLWSGVAWGGRWIGFSG